MKTLTLFYLANCPYCQNARKALEELLQENPGFQKVELDWIEESQRPEIAERYDYYFVPTVFFGKEKLYEANPAERYDDIKRNLKKVLEHAGEKI